MKTAFSIMVWSFISSANKINNPKNHPNPFFVTITT